MRDRTAALECLTTGTPADWEREVTLWTRGRAYEKLALAESLLPHLKSDKKCPAGDHEWEPGTNDMSRVAGRAKWALKALLDASVEQVLPDVVPSSSPEDLKALYEQAKRLVEAYRSGMIALARDYPLSPEKLADLKRRYGGGLVMGSRDDAADQSAARFDALLGDWPPIGRTLEELVSIVRADMRDVRPRGMVQYVFEGERSATVFGFAELNGVIDAVEVNTIPYRK
jgi:hypothetical protein